MEEEGSDLYSKTGDKTNAEAHTWLERLEENIGAVAVELTADDLRKIDSAASKITVQGARYPEESERRTGR